MLKWNKDKSKFIVLSSIQHPKRTEKMRINIGSIYIHSSMSMRNQEFISYDTLWMEKKDEFYMKVVIIK